MEKKMKFAGLSQRALGEAFLVGAGQAIYIIGGLVFSKLLAHSLGPVGYGQWSLIYSVVGIIVILVHGPLGQWLLRHYAPMKDNDLSTYFNFSNIFIWLGVFAVLGLPIFLNVNVSFETMLYFGSPVLALLYGNIFLLQNIYTAQRSRARAAAVVGMDTWLKVLLVGAAIYIWGEQYPYWILLFGFSSFITTLFFWQGKVSFRSAASGMRNLPWRSFWKYSSPFLVLGALGGATTQADKWLVGISVSDLELGFYSAAILVALTPCHLLGYMVSQLFTPIVFDAAGSGMSVDGAVRARRHLWTAIFVLVALSTGLLFLIYFFGDELITLLTSREFLPAKPLLVPLVLSGVIFQVGQLLSLSAMVANNTRSILIPKALQTATFLMLVLFFIGRYGTFGVAYSHLVSAIMYTGAMFIMWCRFRKTQVS